MTFSRSQEEHVHHVPSVLHCLLQNHLYVKAEKCEFHVSRTTFSRRLCPSEQNYSGAKNKNGESAYREDGKQPGVDMSLNVDKTKEMVVDFRRAQSGHSLLYINRSSVEINKSTKFLGVHLAQNFTWSHNTSSISKKAQQHISHISN
ncbi:hypothetical protein QTP86_024223 [Hemibagrus guttatus]|nr:hypothetical protein QTP86_024223 [Hemibagrus guttatus]